MADIEHKNITDPQIHEPKGASTAAAGTAYVADGVGSGSWTFVEPANAGTQLANKVYVTSGTGGDWKFVPTGWGQYTDAATSPATQVFTTTPQKLQIDGAGAASTSSFLPAEIRGSGELWSVADDKITPITIGDSYDVRLDFTVSATTGSAAYILLELDMGGTASPTTVILTKAIAVFKTPPFNVSIGFPIYSLATFVSNGGQLFLSVDTGTATITNRAIFIKRDSAGDF